MTANKRRNVVEYLEKYETQNESTDIHYVLGSVSPARAAYQQDSEQVIRNQQEGRVSEMTTNRTAKRGRYSAQDNADVIEGLAAGMTTAEIGLLIGRKTKSVTDYVGVQGLRAVVDDVNLRRKKHFVGKVSETPLGVFDDMISVSEERVTKLKALRQAYRDSDNQYIRESLLSLAENLNRCGTL
jgi:hypothetical protein